MKCLFNVSIINLTTNVTKAWMNVYLNRASYVVMYSLSLVLVFCLTAGVLLAHLCFKHDTMIKINSFICTPY